VVEYLSSKCEAKSSNSSTAKKKKKKKKKKRKPVVMRRWKLNFIYLLFGCGRLPAGFSGLHHWMGGQ
jgi:hypothetical protein